MVDLGKYELYSARIQISMWFFNSDDSFSVKLDYTTFSIICRTLPRKMGVRERVFFLWVINKSRIKSEES